MARIDTLSNFLTDIAIAIRKKTNLTTAIKAANFDEEIDKIVLSTPNNTFIANRYTKSLSKIFSTQTNLPDEFILDISNLNSPVSCSEMFSLTGNVFNLKSLTILGDTSIINNFYRFLKCRPALETINGILNFSNTTNVNEMFSYCINLANVTFKENSLNISLDMSNSSKLTDESIQSIINGLNYSESYPTIKFNVTVKNKLTQNQIDTISAKGWLLA